MLEVCGSKRKAKSFKDEEYFISSVPTNHVGYTSFVSSNVSFAVTPNIPHLDCLFQFYVTIC